MAGRLIRTFGSLLYSYPSIEEDVPRQGPFGKLKMALVTDALTTESLSLECRIKSLTPKNYAEVLRSWQPDVVFIESAFHGKRGAWRYELAKQPKILRLTKPTAIYSLVAFAKERGIPTIFWNKDDGAFFNAFIDVAQCCDHVFTTDSRCVPRYRQVLPQKANVHTLPIPYQPAFHNFTGFHFRHNAACFAGSYYRRILNKRRHFLDMIFAACADTPMQLHVYDRNHHRFSHFFEFRYPRHTQLRMHRSVSYRNTARLFKEYALSLNVNSVTGSETMFSRRLLEILACGGIAVTNPSRAVDTHFREYCHVVSTQEEATELFSRFKFGPSKEDLHRAESGARYVRTAHTWEHRLADMAEVVPF